MIRCLSIVPYKIFPAKFGGQKGIAGFLQALGERIPLLCLCSNDNTKENGTSFRIDTSLPVSKSQWFNPFIWQKIENLIDENEITHVILEHSYFGLLAPRLKKKKLFLIVHEHNLEYIRFRESRRLLWPLMKRVEKKALRSADLVLFKTSKDRDQAMREFGIPGDQAYILPYAAKRLRPGELAQLRKQGRAHLGAAENELILFFCGTLDYAPNARAVEEIVQQLMPVLQQRLSIPFRFICSGRIRYPSFQYLKNLSAPQFEYLGELDEVAEYFAAADVFVNPVDSGAGIQTKNIEALSYNLPVISSVFAAEGMPTETAAQVYKVENGDWNGFAEAIAGCSERTGRQTENEPVHPGWDQLVDTLLLRLKGEA